MVCSIDGTVLKKLNNIYICTTCRQATDKESQNHTRARQEFFMSLFREDSRGRPLYKENDDG
jgi:hypothetical protein